VYGLRYGDVMTLRTLFISAGGSRVFSGKGFFPYIIGTVV
jgi:hypothetical protein